MTAPAAHTGPHPITYRGPDLLRVASAAAERAPQLADEIREHARTITTRVSKGVAPNARDVDVRTLVALIGQTGVLVPIATRR